MKTIFFVLFSLYLSTPSQAITNGRPLGNHEYSGVVYISDAQNSFVGTGVLIGKDTILTAEHCTFPKNLRINNKAVIEKILVPKTRLAEFQLDLALIKVKRGSISGDIMNIDFKTPLPGAKVEIVGFGGSFSAEAGIINEDVVKRIGFNYVKSSRPMCISIQGDFISKFNQKAPSLGLPGDSGGPMIKEGRVIGIASKSDFGFSQYIHLNGEYAQDFLRKAKNSGWDVY